MFIILFLLVSCTYGVVAQFVTPPNSDVTGQSNLQYTEGSTVTVSWNLPSDATNAQSKLYLWLDPGDSGIELNGNTTLDYFDWTVDGSAFNLSDVNTFHMTLYAVNKVATAGQGYFSTVRFAIVPPVVGSSASASTATTATTSLPSSIGTSSASSLLPITQFITMTIAPSSASTSSLTSSTSTPTSSNTAPAATQTSPISDVATTHTGLATSTKIGLGVGVGLGVAVVAALGFFLYKRFPKDHNAETKPNPIGDVPYTQYYERAELPGAQHQVDNGMHDGVGGMPKYYQPRASELYGS